ncbi:helix-turn-helix domain-containing protein [Nitrolancea hollandica]|uniref:helix-turn-helix domain-containing protein n=1 Tax=Nitrolancea hollandica TaxID=1206749 RepID=UPI0002EADEC6|nr:helix-turn-helix domain-containing protein [Nitrolancea hollandica]
MPQEIIDQAINDRQGSGVVTVPEAAKLLGGGRDWAYREVAATGRLAGIPVIRIGRKIMVPRQAIERLLAGETLPGQEAGR